MDFRSLSKKLIREIDGGQHNNPVNIKKDDLRQGWLKKEGYTVLRFWDNDALNNSEGVFSVVQQTLMGIEEHPHPTFSPPREKVGLFGNKVPPLP